MPSWTIASIRGLTERAARLLVGKHVAQRGHLRGEIGEVLVGVVDDAEPLVQHAQGIHGVARGLFHRLADAMGHRIQPLADRPRHLGLAAGQCLPQSRRRGPVASLCARIISLRRSSSSSAGELPARQPVRRRAGWTARARWQ